MKGEKYVTKEGMRKYNEWQKARVNIQGQNGKFIFIGQMSFFKDLYRSELTRSPILSPKKTSDQGTP
jgi:hypothetical protein